MKKVFLQTIVLSILSVGLLTSGECSKNAPKGKDYPKLEQQFEKDSKSGKPWSQPKVDKAEIPQAAIDKHNERIRQQNPSLFQSDDD